MASDVQTHIFKTVGDCELRADVYRAPGGGRRPVVLWLHGGALIIGHRDNLAPWQRDVYLDAGYHLVAIDYRLAPETKLPAIIEDLQDAWRWVRETGPDLFGADPDRIAVVGHSAGAYLTLMAGFRLEPRPRALVAFYGYGDLLGEWHLRADLGYWSQPPVSTEEAWAAVGKTEIPGTHDNETRIKFFFWCRQQGLWSQHVIGLEGDEHKAALPGFSPIHNITADYPPTLLIHGDQDAGVPYRESLKMGEALTQAGVQNEVIIVPGVDHGFDGADNAQNREVLQRVLGFLAKHV